MTGARMRRLSGRRGIEISARSTGAITWWGNGRSPSHFGIGGRVCRDGDQLQGERPGSPVRRSPGPTTEENREVLAVLQCTLSLFGSGSRRAGLCGRPYGQARKKIARRGRPSRPSHTMTARWMRSGLRDERMGVPARRSLEADRAGLRARECKGTRPRDRSGGGWVCACL